jgi:hypothetical protein
MLLTSLAATQCVYVSLRRSLWYASETCSVTLKSLKSQELECRPYHGLLPCDESVLWRFTWLDVDRRLPEPVLLVEGWRGCGDGRGVVGLEWSGEICCGGSGDLDRWRLMLLRDLLRLRPRIFWLRTPKKLCSAADEGDPGPEVGEDVCRDMNEEDWDVQGSIA